MNAKELKAVVEKHRAWLAGEAKGVSANLAGADLTDANLTRANLTRANLMDANLMDAHLAGANLTDAYLVGANLAGANLTDAYLVGANLMDANLADTKCDPANIPNAKADDFQDDPEIHGWIIGYRTRSTSAAGRILVDDRIYGCEVFSTADTECHPGWYLWPSFAAAHSWNASETVKVRTRRKDVHKAESKWRTRTIWIIGTVTE
jgi:uncharacterized protein YjbI with pentapeptide repeats